MSNTRYFEIVSTYRNRKLFPNPASFDVLIAQTGTRSQFDAYDPVSDAAPLITWSPDETIVGLKNISGEFVYNSANTNLKFLVKFPNSQKLKQECDYYIGMPISVYNNNPPLVMDPLTYITTISGWEYSCSTTADDYFFVSVYYSLPSPPLPSPPSTPSIKVNFIDPTNINIGLFYIPNSLLADGFYTNCILWNETQQKSVKILTYNGNNHIAGVDPNEVIGWMESNTLSIRKKPPIFYGVIGTPSPTSITKFKLQNTASKIPNEYVNNFIYFTTGTNKGKSYSVISYTGIPVPCPPPCVLPQSYEITLDIPPPPSPPPSIPTNTDQFEILQFTRDNVVPFTYTGSTVSQQQMVCYEVQLINLVLPNITLKSGGRVAFYPYVYVELQNITSGGNSNIIYSNNPNSVRRLFRAAIDDIPNPLISPFIKIDGDGMTQTIKFKPNDNFKFGVYLSDGTEFKTVLTDSYGPAPANPLVQISAMFSMKRVS